MPKRRHDESASSSSSDASSPAARRATSRRAASPESSSDSDAQAAPGPTRSAAAEALFKWAKAGAQAKDLKEDAGRRPANGAENGSSRRKDEKKSRSKDKKSAKDKGKPAKKESAKDKDSGKEKSKSKTEKEDKGKDTKKKHRVDEKKEKSKAKKANGEDKKEKAGKDKKEKVEKPKEPAKKKAPVSSGSGSEDEGHGDGQNGAAGGELESLLETLEEKRREKALATDSTKAAEIEKEIQILARWLEEKQRGTGGAAASKATSPEKEPAKTQSGQASPSASSRGPSAERARPKAEAIEQELDRLRGALAGAGRAGVPAPAAAAAALSTEGSPPAVSSAVTKVAPASAIAEDYFVVPPVGRKMPPCDLPVWCVIPNPDDIEIGVEILRRTIGGRVAPKRLLLGKRAWVLLGRRLPEGLATGPEPDIGLAAPRASRAHVLLLRNWMGQVFLMDLGSTHGTYLDGQRLKPREAVRWKVGVEAFFADKETEVFELRPAG